MKINHLKKYLNLHQKQQQHKVIQRFKQSRINFKHSLELSTADESRLVMRKNKGK